MNPYSTDGFEEMSFVDPEHAVGFDWLGTSLEIFHGWSRGWFVWR